MSLPRYAAQRDKNEKKIVDALERVGAHVERLSKPCDLLVTYRAAHYAIEVTNPESKYRKRSTAQLEVLARMRIPQVRTADEALHVIGAL